MSDSDTTSTGAPDGGSGEGGALGTPSWLPDEAPPSVDQENNKAVSGGGVVGPEDDDTRSDAAEPSTD